MAAYKTDKDDLREEQLDDRAELDAGKCCCASMTRKMTDERGKWMLERIEASGSSSVYDREKCPTIWVSECRSVARSRKVAAYMLVDAGAKRGVEKRKRISLHNALNEPQRFIQQ